VGGTYLCCCHGTTVMDVNFIDILVNNGVAVGVIIWFMLKNNKDMDTFRNIIQTENQQTREVLNDLKVVIAKIGGSTHE
jgi:hypothetical protein